MTEFIIPPTPVGYVHIIGEILKDTGKALLTKFEYGEGDFDELLGCHIPTYKTEWFPVSQLKSVFHDPEGGSHLFVSDWICKQKGLDTSCLN